MDLLDPIWAPLIGLLVLVAVVAAAVRVRTNGSPRMTRAMVTVGGGIVVVSLIGAMAEGCAGPDTHDTGATVTGR